MRDRSGANRTRRVFFPAIESMETRQVLSAMLGLTSSGQLASFESSRPDEIGSLRTITGLQPGETVLGIDSRPATGQLFGLGSTGRLYTIDPATGASSPIGAGPIAAALSGTEYDLDFNPVDDRLRIVSNGGLNIRVNPNTAEVLVDANLAYAPTDPGNGTTPDVVATAYTNNIPGATNTTLFDIEIARNMVVLQGSVGGVPVSPNTGQLVSVSPVSLPVAGAVGLEITPDGDALLSQQPAGQSITTLSRIDLNTGTLTPIGAFAAGVIIRDITSAPRVEIVYAVTITNSLISFRSNTPRTLIANVPILGLLPGETIQSLDFRPATGQLYGFGSLGLLYTIQPTGLSAGRASPISVAPIHPPASGSKPSIEFDPTTDQIRLVTNVNQDLIIHPDTAAVTSIDPSLAYSGSDLAAGTTPSVVAQAFSNNRFDASTTSLFGIDSARDTLILQGSPGGSPSSISTGRLSTLGSLGRNVSEMAGFDISSSGLALVSINDAGTAGSVLAVVNLQTGALTEIGEIGGGMLLKDIAISPSGLVQFSAATYEVSQSEGIATIIVTRLAGDSGPLQVAYRTSDGTARAGVNYTAVSGILSFADGETVKAFTVPIRGNSISRGIRTVNLSLSSVSDSVAIGSIGSAVLTITASHLDHDLVSATFAGAASAIQAVELTFGKAIDPTRAGVVANYQVRGILPKRGNRSVEIAIVSATYDPATVSVRLAFATSFALRNFRGIQVIARGFGMNGSDIMANYTVLRGTVVRYVDRDGDRVALGVTGRKAKIVVLRRAKTFENYAWVEGPGRTVFGAVIRGRKSDHRAIIDRFVTNGSRFHLPSSIVVSEVVFSG